MSVGIAIVEQRLATLEQEVAEIKRRLNRASDNWLDRVSGSMKDYPEFGEVVRLGREFRETT